MRPLIRTPESNEQTQELFELFLASGIRYKERHGTFISPPMIWVEEEDFGKAREIAASLDASFAEKARLESRRSWEEDFKGSYVRWLAHSLSRPGNVFWLAILLVVITVSLVYPVMYVLRLGG
jgi:hypothetical protein